MRRIRFIEIFAATGLFIGLSLGTARSDPPEGNAVTISVEDFSYLDTSGEASDQVAAHQRRLHGFMAALKSDFTADRRFHLVPSSCGASCTDDASTSANRLHAASQSGVNILIIGAVQKTSTLVQWARVSAIDMASNHAVFEKMFTFRGDNDESWQRAEAFISKEIRAALADGAPSPAAAAAPIRLAVFPFELEDASAGAETAGETASDVTGLLDTTKAVRQLLAQSGRYQIIDAGTDAVAGRQLHDCGGCDLKLALALGADQSMVGVIRRVSRTEYTVRFEVRDVHSGTVVSKGESGLRMGANYSWSRGAVRLLREGLLESGTQQ